MIIQCPKCGNLVSDKATVCPSCGSSLSSDRPNTSMPETPSQKEEDTSAKEDLKNRSSVDSAPPAVPRPTVQTTMPVGSWASEGDEKNNSKKGIISAIVITVIVFIVGAFFLVRFLNSPSHKLGKVPSLFDKQQYEQVAIICDGVLSSFSSLSDQNKRDLAIYYGQLAQKTDNKDYKKKFSAYIKTLYEQNDSYITQYLDNNYPDETNHIRLLEAYNMYSLGKMGNARTLCNTVSAFSNNLSFADKCDLASLLCAIGTVEEDNNLKKECAVLYAQTCAFNESEALQRYSANDAKLKIDIKSVVKNIKIAPQEQAVVRTSTPIRSVVVTGTNVRVRKGPGLNFDPITDYSGKNIHPDKGQRLEYLGEAEDFYRIKFRGYECWISKQFAVASTDPVE